MTSATNATDLGFGLAIAFTTLAILAAVATTGTSYVYALSGDHGMQVLSGVAVALAVLFGGVAIAAMHIYGE